MKKNILYIIPLLIVFNCATKPEIIRKLIPLPVENTYISNDVAIQNEENIKVTLRFIDTPELQELAIENNPNLEDDTPLFTAFKIIIENKSTNQILFDINNAFLNDGLDNGYQALTYESFKALYSSSIYQKHEYTYVFDRYFFDPKASQIQKNTKKLVKTLFKGNKIPANSAIEGIIPFERINERAKNLTLELPDIILNVQENTNKKQTEKKIRFTFQFRQKIVRLVE